ncbi:MAG: ribosome silencing factor [Thermoanaerobacteraceae bacterium]|nr:ribosome silencing factor [Thermoanaerobacteraceae bacterium]
MTDTLRVARVAAQAARDKRGQEVVILDIRKISLIADYFVITHGISTTQVQAIAREIEEKVAEAGGRLLRREGYASARWVLLDFGGVVVHVFLEEDRRFYDLERLWADAELVELEA